MFRPPSLRSTATTLAAAAVLVGGADLASYAATGHPLVLGHANSAVGTTSLKNIGRGPALSLNSIKSSPPLVVNSSKVVRHLNASAVQGMNAAKLEPKTIRFHLGSAGTNFAGGSTHFFTTKVPRGSYEISLGGLVTEDSITPSDSFTCVVADKQTLLAVLGGSPPNFARFYAITDSQGVDPNFGVVDYTNSAQDLSRRPLAFGCIFQSSGTFNVLRPLTFTLRRVTAQDKTGKKLPIAKSAARRLTHVLG